MNANVYALLSAAVDAGPDRPALVEARRRGRVLTYGDFDRRVAAFAEALLEDGVAYGDRVIVMMAPCIELYVALAAAMRVGAVSVFVDPHMKAPDFEACVERIEPKVFVGSDVAQLLRVRSAGLADVPRHYTSGWFPGAKRMPKSAPTRVTEAQGVASDDPALIGYSTGSSGRPRGSVRSHGFIRAQLRALDQPPTKQRSRVDLPGFPVLPLEDLCRGRTVVLPDLPPGNVAQVKAGPVVSAARRHAVDMLSGSPAYLDALVAHLERAGVTLPGVKVVFTGGAPVHRRQLERYAAAWPQAEVVVVYGSTEAEPVSSISWPEIAELGPRYGGADGFCVGRPVQQIEVCILPLDDDASEGDPRARALAATERGQIVVRGEHVNEGYWNDREGEAANKIRDEGGTWHRMGDAGFLDEAGRLWILGRCHAAFVHNSEVVFAYPVESAAMALEGVSRAGCICLEGGPLVAYEGRSDVPAEAVRQAVAHLGVRDVRRVATVPVDPRHNTKVDYAALRELLSHEV